MDNELYIDFVTRTIISKLSEEISGTIIADLKERNRAFTEKEMPAVIAGEIEKRIDPLERKIASMEQSIRKLSENVETGILPQFAEQFEKQRKAEQEAQKCTEKEFKGLKVILETARERSDEMKETMRRMIQEQSVELEEWMRQTMQGQAEELKQKLKNEFSEMMKSFRETTEQQHELLTGMFYSIKKQNSSFNHEKEYQEAFRNRLTADFSEMRQSLSDITANQNRAVGKGDFKEFNDDFRNRMSALTEKTAYLDHFKEDIVSLVDSSNQSFLREWRTGVLPEFKRSITESRVDENEIGKLLRNELSEFSKRMQDHEAERGNLMTSLYYSVKKISTALERRDDEERKVEITFINSLDVLYSHIRRLEKEKDELGLDLLRLGGDRLQKEKLLSIEKELQKKTKLAEKYLREKNELEERLLKFEEIWKKNLEPTQETD